MWRLDDRRQKVWVEKNLDVNNNPMLRRTVTQRQRVLYDVGLFVLLTMAVICVGIVTALLRLLLPAWRMLIAALALLVGFLLCAVLVRFWERWVFIRYGGGQLRKAGLCACCLYDMTKSPVEEDGCTVCAECGAAWKMSTTVPRDEVEKTAHG